MFSNRSRALAVSNRTNSRIAYLVAKRAVDIAGAIIALVLLAPVMFATALLVRLRIGSPVLYGQVRVGAWEKPIRIWKFRTMTDERGPDGQLLPDEQRLTAAGRWLRERSLDELPQLLNVLRGDVSLVGPRPLLVRYLSRYNQRQRRRHDVKPGITGWAQVHGRNALDWPKRLELDVWYVDHASFGLDLRIMTFTVLRTLQRDDVRAGGGADFDEFWGDEVPPPAGPRAFPVETDEAWPTQLNDSVN